MPCAWASWIFIVPAAVACPEWCARWSCNGASWCSGGQIPQDCMSCGTDTESTSSSPPPPPAAIQLPDIHQLAAGDDLTTLLARFRRPDGSNARRIAVVGSSGNLLYRNHGREIDSHDVVIRGTAQRDHGRTCAQPRALPACPAPAMLCMLTL